MAASAEAVSTAPLTRQQKTAVARTHRAFGTYGDAQKVMATIAKAIVSLRLTFDKDGRPDYRGETPQYRGAIAALYEATIADETERRAFKVAIRYWVAKEFASRVEKGTLKAKDLQAAGVGSTLDDDDADEPITRERRTRTENGNSPLTGVIVDGNELTPNEVVAEAERILAEHVVDPSLGIVMSVQHVARELGSVVQGLRNEDARSKQPTKTLKSASEQMLLHALDAASLGGVDVVEFVGTWTSDMKVTA